MHLKPFNCDKCQRKFAASYAALAHSEICKTGSLTHCCNYCGANFARKFALDTHIDEAHKEEIIEFIFEEEVDDNV